MGVGEAPALNVAELGQLLWAVDPAAVLLAPRLLRRVIKQDRQFTAIGLEVPHRKSYVIGRDALLALTTHAELAINEERALPPVVLLLEQPDPTKLAALGRDGALVEYWRRLFHASVHRAMTCRLAQHGHCKALVRARIHAIGQTEFDEIRMVLRQERYLLPPFDDRTVFEEFAAVYLELKLFAATLLPSYFSTLGAGDRIDRLLELDLDAAGLFAATRLAGAPDPVFPPVESLAAEEPVAAIVDLVFPEEGPETEPRSMLLARAERAAAAGNTVRALLCRARARRRSTAVEAKKIQGTILRDLDRLVARLVRALPLEKDEASAWRGALAPLLAEASHGFWAAEARLLYDLQKICLDHERPRAAPDLVEWMYAGFRRPLARPLPNQPLVLAVKHLRRAIGRLPVLRVAEGQRANLARLLQHALEEAEYRLRERFRPLFRDALGCAGLEPKNLPEQVAWDKLLEELLDRVVESGFLNLGDLRDAIARNQLKLPDLANARELFAGDPLLCANRALAERAPGVYRRGEIYLRCLQRASALVFGTSGGRWFTRFIALPFGAAFATIIFAEEILRLAKVPVELEAGPLAITVGGLGMLNLLLIHVPSFRYWLVRLLTSVGRLAKAAFIEFPAAILRVPLVRRMLMSRPFKIVVDTVLKPLPIGVVAGTVLGVVGVAPATAALVAAATLVSCSLFLNSRLGRAVEEAVGDWLARRYQYLRNFLPGLFRLVMEFFARWLEEVDRWLYSVDEWLRFRSGEGRFTLVVKTVLGFGWFLVTYVVRLYVNVLIEPAVNPIKHFPAVTVGAKLLFPFWIPLTRFFATSFMFLGAPLAYIIAFLNVHTLPGAAGFLVWELKENWRLYRANRPRTLRPVLVGRHGETLARLLRPGFHSGTLPRLYAKRRRTQRKAHQRHLGRTIRRLQASLAHVEESIGRFVTREFLALLNAPPGFATAPVELERIETSANRIRVVLTCTALGTDSVRLEFEEQSGWLLAQVTGPPWLSRLAAAERTILANALAGFFQLAAVDLVRPQLEACFPPPCPPYDIADRGLVVWPGTDYQTEVVYDLRAEPDLHPRVVDGPATAALPVLRADQLFLRRRPIAWEDWVAAWEQYAERDQDRQPLLPELRLLPGESPASAAG